MEDFPISQNRVYIDVDAARQCPRGNITLKQDSQTGIVFNESFREDNSIYDEHYQNEQGYSLIFQQHLEQVARIIDRNFRGKSILEIGCGKGTFLELLSSQGFSITGIDPAYEGNSEYILKTLFSRSLGISSDSIMLRHVLEHIPDPVKFLISIREANGGKGYAYIETPCLDWICKNRAWFDIYHEHVNYFRLSDFFRLFGNIVESGKLFGGQYLYIVADLASLNANSGTSIEKFRLPNDFLAGINYVITQINSSKKRKNILWGAASKGVVFALLLLRQGGILPDFAIDINPMKQGKYLPITAVPVVSPHNGLEKMTDGDAIFIVNSNYYEEIKSIAGSNLTYYKVDNDF